MARHQCAQQKRTNIDSQLEQFAAKFEPCQRVFKLAVFLKHGEHSHHAPANDVTRATEDTEKARPKAARISHIAIKRDRFMLGLLNHMHQPERCDVRVGVFEKLQPFLNHPPSKTVGHALKTSRICQTPLQRFTH